MTTPYEDQLRDYLVGHLDLIEEGLTLVEQEYLLANARGAKGFIDLLARDAAGLLVIIELKRSDQAARQAVHELSKYVGLVLSNLGVRLDQLRCILVSTEWRELLVPFAKFAQSSDFWTLGKQLNLDERGVPVSTSDVELPTFPPGLEICPCHVTLLFASEPARETARKQVRSVLESNGAKDYFFFELDYKGPDARVIYAHAIYVVMAEFDEEQRRHLESRLGYEDGEEMSTETWEHEQEVQSELTRALRPDEVSIGNPDKFAQMREHWGIGGSERAGQYDEMVVWSDDVLIGLAAGDDGAFATNYSRVLRVANKPAWARMNADLSSLLEGAGDWQQIVNALLDEIGQRPSAEMGVDVYNPTDILNGLFQATLHGTGDYFPRIDIGWADQHDQRMYLGFVYWDGTSIPASVEVLADEVFDGDLFSYHYVRALGGVSEFENGLCASHGLTYGLFEFLPGQDTEAARLLLVDGQLTRVPQAEDDPACISVGEFLAAHEEYFTDLADRLASMIAPN